jgi:2-polyprenyl-3-methyl-5-hydroxy-6-metoxy-1,4-benzoquinol methylase
MPKMNRHAEPVYGNFFDKYGSKNPIVRFMMGRYMQSLHKLVSITGVVDIHEIGCGEGNLCISLAEGGKHIRGSDISSGMVHLASERAAEAGFFIPFKKASIYDLRPEKDAAPLVLACEVLEHLEDSQKALEILSQLSMPYLLVSVPREPLWRMLNIARGRYLSRYGNTPGHIQAWSKRGFLRFLSTRLDVLRVATPLPWTMALCRCRDKSA